MSYEASRNWELSHFTIFAERVKEHHDDPNCNRRLYRENIAHYGQCLDNWIEQLEKQMVIDRADIHELVKKTRELINIMLADPDHFSSARPTTPPAAQSDPQ